MPHRNLPDHTTQDSHYSVTSDTFSLIQFSCSVVSDHTWKTIALTRWTFVGKVMSLLLNMLSRLVITFLPRSKRLLISWLQSPSAVILEPRKIKPDTVSPSIYHEVMGPDILACLVFNTEYFFLLLTSLLNSIIFYLLSCLLHIIVTKM